MMQLERVRARIAQLMRVAENSAATEGEVENALRAARNLMLTYHVEEAQINDDAGDEFHPEMDRVVVATRYTRATYWEKMLSVFATTLIGGIGSYFTTRDPDTRIVVNGQAKQFAAIIFYGVRDECQLAADTYEELSDIIYAMAAAKFGGACRGDGGLYAHGFVTGLMKQLDSLQQETQSTPTDLVTRSTSIVEAKQARARDWLYETQNIRLTASRRQFRTTGSREAHEMGVKDGKNHDLSRIRTDDPEPAAAPKYLAYDARPNNEPR